MTSPPTTPQGSAGRAGAIMAVFAQQSTATAQEISRHTGIPSSAVYRHLRDLVRLGLASTTRTRGRYCAGSLTVRMAENYRREALGGGAVRTRLDQLASDTGELAALLVPSGNSVLCVDAADGPGVVKCSYSPGLAQPMTYGASAQAILAHLPASRFTEVCAAHGLDEAAAETLAVDLRRVRDRGYAMTTGAVDEGVWGVSVPVFDRMGAVTGTVSTMAPAFRARQRDDRLLPLTLAAAQDISRI